MNKLTLIPLLAGLLAGCTTTPLKVTQLQEFHPDSRRLVLLSSSRFDTKLRLALAKKGFTLLQFASQEKVIGEGGPGELATIYNKAAASYGLSMHGEWSAWGSPDTNVALTGTCELTDLRTGEVIFVFELNGSMNTVLDQLAAELDRRWGGAPP